MSALRRKSLEYTESIMVKPEKALLSFFSAMDKEGQTSLLEYAEFLAERHPAEVTSSTPLDITRP